jgi:hypothetical protein
MLLLNMVIWFGRISERIVFLLCVVLINAS